MAHAQKTDKLKPASAEVVGTGADQGGHVPPPKPSATAAAAAGAVGPGAVAAAEAQPATVVDKDNSLREHLLYLLRGGGAHLNFDAAIADLPSELRGRTAA